MQCSPPASPGDPPSAMRDGGLDVHLQAAQNFDASTTTTKAPSDIAEELASQLFDIPTELPTPSPAAAQATTPMQQHGQVSSSQPWAPHYMMMMAPHAAADVRNVPPAQKCPVPPMMWYPQPALMHAHMPTFQVRSK